eukprot:6809215-Prymnesium_polylepis.1
MARVSKYHASMRNQAGKLRTRPQRREVPCERRFQQDLPTSVQHMRWEEHARPGIDACGRTVAREGTATLTLRCDDIRHISRNAANQKGRAHKGLCSDGWSHVRAEEARLRVHRHPRAKVPRRARRCASRPRLLGRRGASDNPGGASIRQIQVLDGPGLEHKGEAAMHTNPSPRGGRESVLERAILGEMDRDAIGSGVPLEEGSVEQMNVAAVDLWDA